jgi:Fic family protein
MYVRKEAVLSSQIEGTQSSLQDVLVAEAKVLRPDTPKDVDEVINYVRAMNYGLARLQELPVSLRLIKEIHRELLTGVRGSELEPGEFRRTQNWIGPSGCTLSEATFVPPPAHQLLDLCGQLETFIHSETSLPLLVKVALAHAQFETIHPFLDGNGRAGRLLITFLLCEQKVLHKPVLYLSYYFKRHRQEYYERLQAVRDQGAWEEWINFFLKGVIEVSHQATETARKVLDLREHYRNAITDKLGRTAANGHKVLEYLFEHPIVSVKQVQNVIGTAYPAANELVGNFEALGILEETTGKIRNRQYILRSYISLFSE